MARDITQLHPRLQEKIAQLKAMCEAQGLALGISECFRSVAEQDALYAQGRTKAGNIVTNAKGSTYSSQHQWGIAFDIFQNIKGQEYSDAAFFKNVAIMAKSIGLAWGGDWTGFVDRPHFYLPDWGSTTAQLKQQYGSFEAFRATWGVEGSYNSKAWVKALQSDLGVVVDGIAGKQTHGACPTLRKGVKGSVVKLMQQRIGEHFGIPVKGGYDGDFGNGTLAAVKEFQKRNGLEVDGICGKNTWRKLLCI